MLNPTPVPHEGRDPNVELHITSRIAQFAVNCLFNSLGSMPLEYFTFSERDFQAELYHQCRSRFSTRAINRQFPNEVAVVHPITLTAESGKSVAAAFDNYGIVVNYTIPDILFHDPVSIDSQWCVAEIKRRSVNTDAESIGIDLRKLLIYVSGQLSFRHSVFILNNFHRHPLTVSNNFNLGGVFTTENVLGILNNQIGAVEHPQPEYLEIWVINPQPAAQNNQDPLFVLERTFYDRNAPGRPWQIQNYVRRGNRLSLNP